MKSLPLTPLQKNCRDHGWCLLREHQAPLAWDPHWVDLALNLNSYSTFADICYGISSKLRGIISVADLIHPDGSFMLQWLRREAAYRLTPALRDEGIGVLYDIVQEAVEDFVPAARNQLGWHTQGFLGFLLLRTRRIYRWAARQSGQFATAEIRPGSEARVLPQVEFDIHGQLVSALVQSLDSPIAWDCVHGMAYHDESLRDVAKRLGIPRSTMSRTVSTPIIERLRRAMKSYEAPRIHDVPTNLSAIIVALRAWLSQSEFMRLVPRPHEALPLPKGFQVSRCQTK